MKGVVGGVLFYRLAYKIWTESSRKSLTPWQFFQLIRLSLYLNEFTWKPISADGSADSLLSFS